MRGKFPGFICFKVCSLFPTYINMLIPQQISTEILVETVDFNISVCSGRSLTHSVFMTPSIFQTGWSKPSILHLCINNSPSILFSFTEFFFRPVLSLWVFFAPPSLCVSFAHLICFILILLCFFSPFCSSLSFYRSSGVKYNRLWYAALAFVTLLLFTAAVGAIVFMAVFYTDPEACLYNKIFLAINGILCFFVSLLAISPFIQKREDLYSKHIIS